MAGSRHSYGVGKNEKAQGTESLVLWKVSLLRRIWMHHGSGFGLKQQQQKNKTLEMSLFPMYSPIQNRIFTSNY